MASTTGVQPEWVKTCAHDKNILDLEPFTSKNDPAKIFRIRSLVKNGTTVKDECFRFESIYDEMRESVVTGDPPLNPLTRKPLLDSDIAAFHKMRAEQFPNLPRLDYPETDNAVSMSDVENAFDNMTSAGVSPEAYAAEVARIDTIMSRGIIDEQSSNRDHRSLLTLATLYELIPMVKRFLPKSNVNKGDLNFATPLHYACRRNNSELIKILIAAGAKTEAKTKSGTFPIRETLSFMYSPKQLDSLKAMIEGGADPNVTDDDGMTLLMTASKFGDAYLEIVKYLLSVPTVNINAVDVSGNTALMFAAYAGYPDVVNYLLSKNAGNYLNKQNKSAYDLCESGAKKHLAAMTVHLYTPQLPKRFIDIMDTLRAIPVIDEPNIPANLQVNSAAVKANKLASLEARVNLFMSTYKLKRKTAEKYAIAYVAVLEQRNALEDAADKAGKPVDESKFLPFPPVPAADAVSVIHNPLAVSSAAAAKKPAIPLHGRPSGPVGSAPVRMVKPVATAKVVPSVASSIKAPSAAFARLTAPKKVVVAPAAAGPAIKLAAAAPAPSPAKLGNLAVVGVGATKKGGRSKRGRRQTRRRSI